MSRLFVTTAKLKNNLSGRIKLFVIAAAIYCLSAFAYFQYKLDITSQIDLHSLTHEFHSIAHEDFLKRHVSPYAYVSLIAGCEYHHKTGCLGFISNIIVAAKILRESGSNNDFVVMVRMTSEGRHDKLLDEHQSMLESAGVIVKYIPKALTDNLLTARMDKFKILDFVDYKRVLYMDSDLIPLCNLDYLFELSDGPNPPLRKNILFANTDEPVNGGIFMLTPNHHDYLKVIDIFYSSLLSQPEFDVDIGWGLNITPPDEWITINEKRGTKWDFGGAFADQGLLYYWTKYLKKDVSIFFQETVKSWTKSSQFGTNNNFISVQVNDDLHLTSTELSSLIPAHQKCIRNFENKYHLDFKHFTGRTKPWLKKPPASNSTFNNINKLWYDLLREERERLNLPLDVDALENNDDTILTSSLTYYMRRNIVKNHLESTIGITSHAFFKEKMKLSSSQSRSRFAYTYLMAGCNPSTNKYLGYILNIIVATKILRDGGSTNDIVVMIRMANSIEDDKLPEKHQHMLESAGVVIKYLPKASIDNFVTAQMDKFRVLNLIEYERVIYMDSDLIPFCNLDYIFDMSYGPRAALRNNVIVAYNHEPAHGGLFMVTPNKEDYAIVSSIIKRRISENNGVFDEVIGWGHNITRPDEWVSLRGGGGTKWNFYGAFVDQGLLYYWTKYVKRDVSILVHDKIESWSNESVTNEDGKVISEEINEGLHRTVIESLLGKGCSPYHNENHGRKKFGARDYAPYSDFRHFTGIDKPWLQITPGIPRNRTEIKDAKDLWYIVLKEEVERLELNINITDLRKYGRPDLGLYPTRNMVHEASSSMVKDSTTNSESIVKSKNAYVFLMAGCNPSTNKYLGYILNIIVATKILRDGGSTNDIVVMIRMANSIEDDKLPEKHQHMLESAGVVIKYLPKASIDNFVTAQMDKFRVLNLIEYERVIYMDSDLIPFCNLDYIFDMSYGPRAALRNNVIVAYNHEPAHGGLFMVTPNKEDYAIVSSIIKRRISENNGVFDEVIGWGHNITRPDEWVSLRGGGGTKWNFYGAFVDQGLLYYWTKYVKRDVSILVHDKIESWSNESVTNEDGKVISEEINEGLHRTVIESLLGKGCSPYHNENHGRKKFGARDYAPYSDFRHFTGIDKPWLQITPGIPRNRTEIKDAKDLWYIVLKEEVERLELNINITDLRKYGRPDLGLFPTEKMMNETIKYFT